MNTNPVLYASSVRDATARVLLLCELRRVQRLLQAKLVIDPASRTNERNQAELEKVFSSYFNTLFNALPMGKFGKIYNDNVEEES